MPKSLLANLAAALHLIVSHMECPALAELVWAPAGCLVRRWWI